MLPASAVMAIVAASAANVVVDTAAVGRFEAEFESPVRVEQVLVVVVGSEPPSLETVSESPGNWHHCSCTPHWRPEMTKI